MTTVNQSQKKNRINLYHFKIMKKEEQELEYVSIFHFYEQLNKK
jgi:hypothetical protein